MNDFFRKVLRINLDISPNAWILECKNCKKIHKGFFHINSNFPHDLSPQSLIVHTVYCNECIPKMLPIIKQGNRLNNDTPDDDKVHICSSCCLVSVGKSNIDERVYLKRGTKTGYQRKCKPCSKNDLESIIK